MSQDLRDKHWLARPFIYIFLQSRKRLQARIQAGRNMLIPLLKARAEQLPEKPQSDLLQWMTESARGADKAPYRLSDKILFLCLASIHTSSSTAVHTLYDLCQYAEDCVPILREEITRTIAENGLTLASINKMKKLDSFIKESQRINHPGTCMTLYPNFLCIQTNPPQWPLTGKLSSPLPCRMASDWPPDPSSPCHRLKSPRT